MSYRSAIGYRVILAAIALLITILPVSANTEGDLMSIVPQPANIRMQSGAFTLGPNTIIYTCDELAAEARKLAECLAPATGYTLRVDLSKDSATEGVFFSFDAQIRDRHGDEAYALTITEDAVLLRAGGSAGAFYGIQTLRQLLPTEIFGTDPATDAEWTIPCCEIEDYPRFGWRGMHLDVSRHFYNADFIKRYIDLLALHKMNRFHWHLVDDQGWRIEIKKYPKLTDIGAWRTGEDLDNWRNSQFRFPGKASGEDVYGGYYTQDQIRDIVAYAKARHIEILPEIEMPGHSWSALIAHPELTCTQTTPGPDGHHDQDVFCAGKEETFRFIEDILDETMALFPFVYLHIGGDEVEKHFWKECADCQARMKREGLADEEELQSYFITRIEKYLNAKGRRLIGWEEILQGGLAPNATVTSWIGTESGIKAARMGHDAIMAPCTYLYFDAYQSDPTREPTTIGYAPNTLSRVYSFEPIPDVLTPEESKRILGAQGQAWTEWMIDGKRVEHMVYPRLCALAEVVWSPKEKRDYRDFLNRMKTHTRRLDKLSVGYRPIDPVLDIWTPKTIRNEYSELILDVSYIIRDPDKYELEMRYSHGANGLDIQRAQILENDTVIATDEHDGIAERKSKQQFYILNIEHRDPDAQYKLRIRAKADGPDSYGEIIFHKATFHPTAP